MLDALLGALFISILFIILYLEYDELDDDNYIENTTVTNIYDRYYAQLLHAHSCHTIQSILRHIQNNVVLSDDERISRQSALDLAHRLQSQLCTPSTFPYHLIWKIVVIFAAILFIVAIVVFLLTTNTQITERERKDEEFSERKTPTITPQPSPVKPLYASPPRQSHLSQNKTEKPERLYVNIFNYYPQRELIAHPIVVKTEEYSFTVKDTVLSAPEELFYVNLQDSKDIKLFKEIMFKLTQYVVFSVSKEGKPREFNKTTSDIRGGIQNVERLSFDILPRVKSMYLNKMLRFFSVTMGLQYLAMYIDWYIVVMKIVEDKNISEEKIDALIKEYIDKYDIKVAGIDDNF